MASLATFVAYEDLKPIIDKIGPIKNEEKLREHLALLLAYHSCSGGFALAYARADLLRAFGVDPWAISLKFMLCNPVVSARLMWSDWKTKRERAAA